MQIKVGRHHDSPSSEGRDDSALRAVSTTQASSADPRSRSQLQHKYHELANSGSRIDHQRMVADTMQRKTDDDALAPNLTGLPDQLKGGIESLSGVNLDGVKVHYNSAQPAQLNAHAYAQGSDIHLGPGQERHLPHEAWHIVQQAQGRVKPTVQINGSVDVNDDVALEAEADVMGAKAAAAIWTKGQPEKIGNVTNSKGNVAQAKYVADPIDSEPGRYFDNFLGAYIKNVELLAGFSPLIRFTEINEHKSWIYVPNIGLLGEEYHREESTDKIKLHEKALMPELAQSAAAGTVLPISVNYDVSNGILFTASYLHTYPYQLHIHYHQDEGSAVGHFYNNDRTVQYRCNEDAMALIGALIPAAMLQFAKRGDDMMRYGHVRPKNLSGAEQLSRGDYK